MGKRLRNVSVALDGYMKVFDYTQLRVTHSMSEMRIEVLERDGRERERGIGEREGETR